MVHLCHICEKESPSPTKLYNHGYDVHVDTLQVIINKKTSIVERIDSKFSCPDCPSRLSTSRSFNDHLKKKHKGTCSALSKAEKRRDMETDDGDNGSSVLMKRHKILGPQLNLDELNSNSLTLPPLHCDHNAEAVAASNAQDQREPNKKEIVFSNIGNWKPIALSSECGKTYYMLASPEAFKHLLAKQPTGLWKPPNPN
ncbi:hypothetical protein G6F29_002878 [Rhizopus arrhizus]|nr:hypothetical protein G6F29_002878 [Rhizopus arrhizus]KAG1417275.1 hypothetical protein G6F58_005593 [Rhizopus delemar]